MIFFQKGNTKFGLLKKGDIGSDIWISKDENEMLNKLKNETRRMEFTGVRQLRNELMPNHPIVYSRSGKPMINKKGIHISISHSNNSICIGITNNPIGIDIEEINERIFKVHRKFTHQDESKFYPFDSMEDLTILWTIKECIYKLTDIKGLSFKDDIKVIKRNGNEHTCIVKSAEGEKQYLLEHEKINNEILTHNIT